MKPIIKKYHGLIIHNGFSKTKSIEKKISRLIEEGSKLGIKFTVKSSLSLTFTYQDGVESIKEIDEKDYDFCIFLDKDKYLASAISKKMRMFNKPQAIFDCDDKMTTYQKLTSLDIQTPKVIPSPLCYQQELDPNLMEDFLDKIENELNYPLVCKESYGSLGKQVYLVKDRSDLQSCYKRLFRHPHMYMEYINYEFGTDYRVILINHEIISIIKRQNESDFRSNIALGGVGTISDLPSKVKSQLSEISKRLDLDYCGIDIIRKSENEYLLLEVNSNAFFEESERVTSLNIASLFLRDILNKIN